MKFRNDGPDHVSYGIHFHHGTVVDVPDDLSPERLAYFKNRYTLVEDEPPPKPKRKAQAHKTRSWGRQSDEE